jgi:hypothetical protein
MERDTDLLKLQILADYYHTRFNLVGSFSLGLIIAMTVALYTLVMQNAISLFVYFLSLFFLFLFALAAVSYMLREYHRTLDGIDELIKGVNKNRFEPLPSIRELRTKKLKK